MNQEDQGFIVKDRRYISEDGSPRENQPEPQTEETKPGDTAEIKNTTHKEGRRLEQLPPVDFNGLILSLSHTTIMHLGHIPDPARGQPHMDLALARHTIDIIGMLKEKTKGNLSKDEQKLIDGVLTELRLAFVQAIR